MCPTNNEVFQNGFCEEDYPCDMSENGDLESNGCIEMQVSYNGKLYLLHRTWLGQLINADNEAIAVEPEAEK
jgi:hypothetical protein